MFNCFVTSSIEDDLGSNFTHLGEVVLTMQRGGEIGCDFSSLRPKGAPLKSVGADASGPLSFMDVWDSVSRAIMSAGARRGVGMAAMRCDHPDIGAFIAAQREPGRLSTFNLSVLVTDDFMRADEADNDWRPVFEGRTWKTLRARELWDSITPATYDYAEPGVIFIDRINARDNFAYCETIYATIAAHERSDIGPMRRLLDEISNPDRVAALIPAIALRTPMKFRWNAYYLVTMKPGHAVDATLPGTHGLHFIVRTEAAILVGPKGPRRNKCFNPGTMPSARYRGRGPRSTTFPGPTLQVVDGAPSRTMTRKAPRVVTNDSFISRRVLTRICHRQRSAADSQARFPLPWPAPGDAPAPVRRP